MLYYCRLLVAALVAASASVTTAVPVLDSGDALEPRLAKLEAMVNNKLELDDKVKEQVRSCAFFLHLLS